MNSSIGTFDIGWHDVNARGDIKIPSLSSLLQEMAWRHADALGVGYEKLFEQGMAWVISRFRLQIIQPPGWLDTIKIKTWPSGLDKFFANREFLVYNDRDEVIAKASSAWLIIDFNSRRLLKPEPLNSIAYSYNSERPFEEGLQRLHPAKEEEKLATYEVRWSDMDKNQHVINTKYIEQVIDTLYAYKGFEQVKEVNMNYQHECLKGDRLELFGHAENGLFICRAENQKGQTAYTAQITYE